MATKKISELDAKTSLAGTEELLINDGGTSKKTTAANLVASSLDGAVVINESGADVDFRIESDTNANAFFLDAGNSRVGIGTSSPSSLLHLSSNGSTITIQDTNGSGGTHNIRSTGSNGQSLQIDGASDIYLNGNNLIFRSASESEYARITSSGYVGIGTSSPAKKFHVLDATGTNLFRLSGLNGFNLDIESTGTGNQFDFDIGSGGGTYTFNNSGGELMRIDSSGNLLVGTTTAITQSGTTTGSRFSSTGIAWHIADDAPSLFLGRTSTDGTIIDFRKDGTTVGSIGNQGADTLYIDSANSTGTGLRFAGNQGIVPRYQGSDSDNVTNLGKSTNRFKDLYLSGGVYLGGTGAANYLDDYEEGTWTPAWSVSGGTITANASFTTGKYVKIGSTVYIWGYISYGSLTGSPTGALSITGLPFTADVQYGQQNRGGFFVHWTSLWTSNPPTTGNTVSSAATAIALGRPGTTAHEAVTFADMSLNNNYSQAGFFGQYQTTS